MVAPGAAPGRFARGVHWALLGAPRVAIGRDRIVVRVVPVAAPFVDVVAHVVKAEGVGRVTRDGFGAGLPASCVVGERLWRGIAPREIILLDTATGSEFPFGFGRQTIGAGSLGGKPFAVAGGVVP